MHGFEREGIRTTADGQLSLRPHPRKLGSSLTHPSITTDFSEPQLELVTPPLESLPAALHWLTQVHIYTATKLTDERIWPFSMPPRLPDHEEQIPLADYGATPLGKEKTLYRRGIGLRYGRHRLTLSGAHYNFSFDSFPPEFGLPERLHGGPWDSSSDATFHVVRNLYRRIAYFTYLFGASPAFDRSFAPEQESRLKIHKTSTLYAPYATSLRMSEIGYTSKVQESLSFRYDGLEAYVDDLTYATRTCNPDYLKLSSQRSDQMNPNYLQVPQELYAPFRLQREHARGADLLEELKREGPGHIEIRLLDIHPESPTGIDPHAVALLHLAMLDSLNQSSPVISKGELKELKHSHQEVVWRGREKGLTVVEDGLRVSFHDEGKRFCERLIPLAEAMDKIEGRDFYQHALSHQIDKWDSPELTPSGMHLADLLDNDREFIDLGLEIARHHANEYETCDRDEALQLDIEAQTLKSLKEEHALERGEN